MPGEFPWLLFWLSLSGEACQPNFDPWEGNGANPPENHLQRYYEQEGD